MHVLVVYDSSYGNTAKVAHTLSRTAARSTIVQLDTARAATYPDIAQSDLILVGSPTQGGRPTHAIQDFIHNLPPDAFEGKYVAAFDTRFAKNEHGIFLRMLMSIVNFAAPWIAKAMKLKGGKLILPAEGFIVESKEGPLAKGELERAEAWMRSIVRIAGATRLTI